MNKREWIKKMGIEGYTFLNGQMYDDMENREMPGKKPHEHPGNTKEELKKINDHLLSIGGLQVGSPEEVNHPKHYGGKNNPYEAIKVIEAWELGFNLGNTIKYISRVGKKIDTLEDLQKASWYINREINKLKNER